MLVRMAVAPNGNQAQLGITGNDRCQRRTPHTHGGSAEVAKNENIVEDQIDENGEVHQIFQGYKYVHGMKLDFPNNADFLGKVITVLSSCPAKPEYKIRYTIADTEAVKNLIIGKAVADARKKAEVLTQAAGIRLGAIQTMEYTWDEIEFVSSTDVSISDTVEETITASARFNVEPENVEASDSVTVIWSIV